MTKLVTDYKAKVASRYMSIAAEQITQKLMEADYYLTSIKYDGHFAMLVVENGEAIFYNRSGEPMKLPAMAKEAVSLAAGNKLILAGEVITMKDGVPGRHSSVASAIAKPENFDIRFGIYDLVEFEGKQLPDDPHEKNSLIKDIVKDGKSIFYIEQNKYDSRKDIANFYSQVTPHNEGIVIRSSNGFVYKVKPQITLDLVIVGFAESAGDRAGLLRDLLLAYVTPDGVYHMVAKCGGGFTDKDREDFLVKLAPMQVPSEYTEISSAKTAFVMIKPELVVEITCLDMINESSSGPVKKMSLKYDEATGYSHVNMENGITCTSPNFYRFRPDKKANAEDAGIEQITRFKEVLTDEIKDGSSKDSEIIDKEVFIKKAKDGTAVRKFTILKTNKEDTGQFPPYVVVYTDFSAGRKSPLDQDIYICLTEQAAIDRVAELKTENIKKGWEAVIPAAK